MIVMVMIPENCFALIRSRITNVYIFLYQRGSFKAEHNNWENATLKSIMSNLCAWHECNITPYENVK
jgi:hypothetical protein